MNNESGGKTRAKKPVRTVKWLITITFIMIICVLVYYRSQNKPESSQNPEKETAVSEISKVLSKDLKNAYPPSVREVVQLFIRIQKCYYNESPEDDQLVKLSYMATELLDEELIENNPYDEYYENLSEEMKLFGDVEKKISRVILDKSSDVKYSQIDGQKYASINCVYYLKDKSGTSRTAETYILRKDENDRWKILGWQQYEENQWEQ